MSCNYGYVVLSFCNLSIEAILLSLRHPSVLGDAMMTAFVARFFLSFTPRCKFVCLHVCRQFFSSFGDKNLDTMVTKIKMEIVESISFTAYCTLFYNSCTKTLLVNSLIIIG